ncbi:MAG TPA: TonB-dependent receptor [Vicinamibacterales bacterium]|nr:TonB-dependent receptor [Vicinamibacterales bacterium]
MPAHAQSTAATVSGVVVDEQKAALPGATISIRNQESGQTRSAVADARGAFRVVGLPPGRYEITAELSGFGRLVRTDVVLNVAQELTLPLTLRVAGLEEAVTVTAELPLVETTRSALGTTITTSEIEALPIAGRNFATLAQLTPGITSTAGSGISSAGQLTRNSTYLIDGLSNDDDSVAGQRGGFSVDAIKEFIVVSNSFSAEYGQSSGAIVSVVTRSGTNELNGRAFYYHRDDSWDASTAASKLVSPAPPKSRLEQKIVGGFFGGPIRRNQAFYFASVEYTKRLTENLVTAPTVRTFLPSDPLAFEQPTTNPQWLGKVDVNLSAANTLAVKYRRDSDKQTAIGIGGNNTRERGQDRDRVDQDVAVNDSWVVGNRGLNELRMQVARRYFNWDVTPYCPNCPTVNRPGLNLGKAANMPQGRTEDRIQIANTFSWLVSDAGGTHALKIGADASFIDLYSEFHNNLDGTFTFTTSAPFDPAVASTYPTQFTKNTGDPIVNLNNNIYAAFIQDQWRPIDRLTINAGLRWDYEDVVGIDHDKNNFAPRLGLVYDLNGSGRTVLRANAGIYYDQIFLNIPLNAENAKKFVQTLITNPGYPDPNGPNPNRTAGPTTPIPSSTQFADDNRTPHTQQVTAGLQRQIGNTFSISADFVSARGRGLLRSSDANYPNLDDPSRARPNRAFQRITVVETKGNSWYQGLQVGVEKRLAQRHAYTIAYTLSSTERDTEDFNFFPVDNRFYDLERGPASNDSRHRVSAALSVHLPGGVQASTLIAARSKLPYNITTGADDNRDTQTNDRPAGTGRNAGRGASLLQADLRLTKSVQLRGLDLELIGEAFNITNQKNWTNFEGNQRAANFGRPTNGESTRQVQLGLRLDF